VIAALLGVVGSPAGCDGERFVCRGADACWLGGEAGLCLAGNCAYPDAACPSGYRYAVGLGNALAGECVALDDVGGSTGDVVGGSTGGSSSSSTRGSTDAEPGSDASSDGGEPSMPASTDTDAFGSTGTDEPTEDSSSSGPSTACDDLSCAGCFACVVEPGEACAELVAACELASDCTVSATCMHACAVKGICIDDCCGDFDDAGVTTAHDLHSCRGEACATACPDLPQPYCSSP
jgi:hypothetical protein